MHLKLEVSFLLSSQHRILKDRERETVGKQKSCVSCQGDTSEWAVFQQAPTIFSIKLLSGALCCVQFYKEERKC